MKFFCSGFAIFLCTIAAGESLPAKVTLEDAKKYAVSNNLEVQGLRSALEEARAQVTGARSGFYPRLGVAGGADYQVSADASVGAPVGYAYGNWNLFRGFGDTYRMQLADIEVDKAERKLKQTEFRIGLEVEEQFFSYLFRKFSIELREKALKENQKHQKQAQQRRAGGLASDSDVMEFDLRDSFLRSELAELALDLESSRVNLRRLLGEKIGEKIEPTGTLLHYKVKGSLGDYLKLIATENESVTEASRQLAQANVEEKLARSMWFPEVDVETQVGYLRIMDRPNATSTTAGGAAFRGLVVAKMNIFEGFETSARQGAAAAKKLRSEAMLKQTILDAVSKAEIGFRTLKAIEAQVDLEELNSDRAERYYKSVIKEYQRGVKNSSDVKNASEQLFQAQVRHEGHKYEYMVEKGKLERLLGRAVDVEAEKES